MLGLQPFAYMHRSHESQDSICAYQDCVLCEIQLMAMRLFAALTLSRVYLVFVVEGANQGRGKMVAAAGWFVLDLTMLLLSLLLFVVFWMALDPNP